MDTIAKLNANSEDLKLMKELVYDERGRLIPAIKEATDEESKRRCRAREHRLAKLYRRIGKCQKYLAKKREERQDENH